jgi:capsular exopolysaccharide synthesis family protein
MTIRGEDGLGKFFEAMQRASEASDGAGTQKRDSNSTVPELDDALLAPEDEQIVDAFQNVDSRTPVTALDAGAPPASDRFPAAVVDASDDQRLRVAVPAPEILKPVHRGDPIPASPFPTLVDTNVYRSPIHAAYERIIQRLLSFRRVPQHGVIVFSSAVAGEGTSTIARNTAFGLGRRERDRVLLVDGNLRTPSIHSTFGIDREPGLSDVLLEAMPLTNAIRMGVATEIDILPAGSRVPSPAQVLSAVAIEGVVIAALSLYDWIIFDSPPVTSYPDTTSIASVCGGALFVISAERTRLEVVEEAKRKLESTGVGVLGAVLNRRRYHIPGFIYNRL